MRSLVIDSYTLPENYKVSTFPVPPISSPKDVVVRVEAACINPLDVKLATGSFKAMISFTFPHRLGQDLSGTVVQVGEGVTEFSIGDNVYGMLLLGHGGTASEYVLASEDRLTRKPASLSHIEAASLPTVAVTALQCLEKAQDLVPGGLEGKTVFVPGGLGGTGSMAVQLAKHVYGAAKVITTVSTSKVAKVHEYLGEGTVDQVIDYETQDVLKEVGKGTVDFYFDTAKTCMSNLSLMKPNTGVIISVTGIPSGSAVVKLMPDTPFIIRRILDLVSWVNRWRAERSGIKFEAHATALEPRNLERISELVQQKKLKPVVGRVMKLSDLEAIKDACTALKLGKGALGKFVIEID